MANRCGETLDLIDEKTVVRIVPSDPEILYISTRGTFRALFFCFRQHKEKRTDSFFFLKK